MNINFAQLAIAGESSTGPVRHHNEDNILIYAPPGASAVLAVLTDGIGGHSRGEIASYICCRDLMQAAVSLKSTEWNGEFLNSVLQQSNDHIFDFNFKSRRIRPMGCTVAAAIFTIDKVIIASAGDSRFYEYCRRPGEKALRQLTVDHRPEGYEELVRSGKIRHISLVSRSVGTAKHLELDIKEIPRHPDAKYMLCSDGLYNRQPDQAIAGVLGRDFTPHQAVSMLVRGAMLAGERDNISVICAAPARKEI